MFARTPRLTLRPAWPEDAPAMAAAIAHEAVVTRLARVPWPYTEAHAAHFVARPVAATEAFMVVLAHDQRAPRLVGGVGIHPSGEEHEIDYWLTPSAWGRGYATEAARAVVAIARHALGLKRLVSGYHVDNPASGRVLAKLGFRETGREQRACLARGCEVECVTVALELGVGRSEVALAA